MLLLFFSAPVYLVVVFLLLLFCCSCYCFCFCCCCFVVVLIILLFLLLFLMFLLFYVFILNFFADSVVFLVVVFVLNVDAETKCRRSRRLLCKENPGLPFH